MIIPLNISVLEAARDRISKTFDKIDHLYVSLSGGKDSTLMLHLVMEEAIKRNKKVGVLIIDLEAQYKDTIANLETLVEMYKDHINLHWVCAELRLRNATSVFEPFWVCWDEKAKDKWVRPKPKLAADLTQYDFYQPEMEFEEFVPLFGEWYGGNETSAAFVGIRADESLNRYKTIAVFKKENTLYGKSWSTKMSPTCYNIYPIYDWKASDLWKYHSVYPNKPHNKVYDKMQMAGVPLKHQRLCQPYGDTQRRGLWLYSILEADTWSKLIARVIGANSYALYAKETNKYNGDGSISKPENLTWEQYSKVLLKSLPRKTAEHYAERIRRFFGGWSKRGYTHMPDEADHNVENLHFAPSWRRVCKTLLRNDINCKGLGFSQPKSEAYGKYLEMKGKLRTKAKPIKWGEKKNKSESNK
jgi:predicted phosphoadenosine phosphosulfate sulfurtransferase